MSSIVRAPRRDAVQNREALLAAARTVLNRDPEAPLDAIAVTAGLSRRAVYGHFATRDALLAELVDAGAARVATAVDGVEHDDPVVELALLGRVVWDEVEHVRAMTQVAVRGPLQHRLAPTLGLLHARIADAVGRAASAGTGRTDLDPDTVARLIGGAAFTVLDESVRRPIARDEGRRLVVLAGLGALGLGWRDAQRVLEAHRDLIVPEDGR